MKLTDEQINQINEAAKGSDQQTLGFVAGIIFATVIITACAVVKHNWDELKKSTNS